MFLMYFQKGGWVMYPLAIFSVVALGLALERLYYFLRLRVNVHNWFQKFEGVSPSDGAALTQTLAELGKHPLRQVLTSLWRDRSLDRKDLEALAQEESEEQVQFLEKNLKPLSVIAILAPLLGLLGTVWGIMQAFMKTQDAAKIDPTLLAGGIWEALITTFVGLAIAIPTWAVYYYLSSRVDRQVFLLEFFSSRFIRWMHGRGLLSESEAA